MQQKTGIRLGDMSYDIRLKCECCGNTMQLDEPHEEIGGNYIFGGTTECWLNITYNYSKHYYHVLGDKGIRIVYGMTGEDSIPVLVSAINQLKDDIDTDYWKSTEGNAKKALGSLLFFARQKPNGVWAGD